MQFGRGDSIYLKANITFLKFSFRSKWWKLCLRLTNIAAEVTVATVAALAVVHLLLDDRKNLKFDFCLLTLKKLTEEFWRRRRTLLRKYILKFMFNIFVLPLLQVSIRPHRTEKHKTNILYLYQTQYIWSSLHFQTLIFITFELAAGSKIIWLCGRQTTYLFVPLLTTCVMCALPIHNEWCNTIYGFYNHRDTRSVTDNRTVDSFNYRTIDRRKTKYLISIHKTYGNKTFCSFVTWRGINLWFHCLRNEFFATEQ